MQVKLSFLILQLIKICHYIISQLESHVQCNAVSMLSVAHKQWINKEIYKNTNFSPFICWWSHGFQGKGVCKNLSLQLQTWMISWVQANIGIPKVKMIHAQSLSFVPLILFMFSVAFWHWGIDVGLSQWVEYSDITVGSLVVRNSVQQHHVELQLLHW